MPEERLDEYLAALDAAADWTPEGGAWDFAPSYDEWNAQQIANGQPAGDFDKYLHAIGAA